jgi:hypothetical protein
MGRGLTLERTRRLALLLADGTGEFDFVQVVGFGELVYLEGRVSDHSYKVKAEQLARYVGFVDIRNAIRVLPED